MTKKVELSVEEQSICDAMRDAVRTSKPRITVATLAGQIGLTAAQLDHILNGRTRPRTKVVEDVRVALRYPEGWPYAPGPTGLRLVSGGSAASVPQAQRAMAAITTKLIEEGRKSIAGTPMAELRVVGKASAGDGESNVDVVEETVWVPDRLAQIGALGWVVEGDSMMPYLEPGDVAIFVERREPRRDYTFLVCNSSGEFRVKNLSWDRDKWLIQSLNPAYGSEPLGSHQLVGMLVGWYRARGRRETMDSDPDGLMLEVTR